MIKVTVYDKKYKYSEDYYYKNHEINKALALAGDYEENDDILVAMDTHSRDYKGYWQKKAGARKMKAALKAAMTPEEKVQYKLRKKQYKLLLKEEKKAAQLEKISEPDQNHQEEIIHHQFSEKFEKNMEEILCRYRKKKQRELLIRSTAVAAAVVVCITGGLAVSSISHTKATTPGVNIVDWVKDYFSFAQYEDNHQKVLFDIEQIGYVPEGFELKEMAHSNIMRKYDYQNAEGKYFTLKICNDSTSFQQHNKDIETHIAVNASGYEYTHIYEKENGYHILMWEDANGMFYTLKGTLDQNTIVKIMDNIVYER